MYPVYLVRHDDGREWLMLATSGLQAINFVTSAAKVESVNLTAYPMQADRAYRVVPGERLFYRSR